MSEKKFPESPPLMKTGLSNETGTVSSDKKGRAGNSQRFTDNGTRITVNGSRSTIAMSL